MEFCVIIKSRFLFFGLLFDCSSKTILYYLKEVKERKSNIVTQYQGMNIYKYATWQGCSFSPKYITFKILRKLEEGLMLINLPDALIL